MWFSSDQRVRPRRRLSHATVVAYLALVIAILGIPAAATAAFVVHTRDIADGAVTHPKIANRAVGRANVRDNAINGAKVANNSLTGANIDLSTLRVTRIARRISGTQNVVARAQGNPYPLRDTSYRQPAGTTEFYFAVAQIRFPPGCTRNQFGYRAALVDLRVDNVTVIMTGVYNSGTGRVTSTQSSWGVAPRLITAGAHTRNVRARVEGVCGRRTDPHPRVLSIKFHVARFR